MWSDVYAFDTRFFRTIGPLLFRPGFLTVEYLEGRREPYVQPLRAYVFASVLFFGLVALFGKPVMEVYLDADDPAASTAINTFVNTAITYVHFFLVPMFAAIVMLFYHRPPRYYVEHLVFAFHYGAFAFVWFVIFGTAARALGAAPTGPQPAVVDALTIAWGTVLFGYLGFALRRVYGRSWAGSFLRAAGIGVLYLVGFGLVSTALILSAYLIYLRNGQIPLVPRIQ